MMYAKSARPAILAAAEPMKAPALLSKYARTSEYCSSPSSANAAGTYSSVMFAAFTSDAIVLLNIYAITAMLNILM
jgi:hypothetical protein